MFVFVEGQASFPSNLADFFVSSGKSPIMLKPIEITSLERGTIFLKDLRTYTYRLIRPLYKAFFLGEADKGGILEVDIDSNMICLALVSCKDKGPPSPCQRSFRELDAYVQVRPLNDLLNCSFVLLQCFPVLLFPTDCIWEKL